MNGDSELLGLTEFVITFETNGNINKQYKTRVFLLFKEYNLTFEKDFPSEYLLLSSLLLESNPRSDLYFIRFKANI